MVTKALSSLLTLWENNDKSRAWERCVAVYCVYDEERSWLPRHHPDHGQQHYLMS